MIEHSGTCTIDTSKGKELRFIRGKGGLVFSQSGDQFIDFILGFGPVIIGHADDEFNDALSRYLKYGIHFPSYSVYHEQFLELLKDSGWSAFSFFKTSSESITATIRLATSVTHRKGIIRCGFIGWHDAEIANTISWHEYPGSIYREEVRFTQDFRGVSGEEQIFNWHTFDLNELEDILKKERIAVFIVDAYQIHLSSASIIRQAFSICKKYGVLTVLDETKTSGRVNLLGVSEYYNLSSDFLVMGKAIANGAPLSVLCGNEELSQNARAARITGTFSKEALGIYCALITQDIMTKRNGYDLLEKAGKKIIDSINCVFQDVGCCEMLEAVKVFNGSMIDLKFKGSIIDKKNQRNALRLFLADNGILMLLGHPSFVCLAHNKLDIDNFKEMLRNAVIQWLKDIRGC